MEKVPITIIGGGVIGNALAYELSETIDGVVLLEKNKSVRADNQSSRNSGVIHAGIYYLKGPQPLKARLCPEGNTMMYEFCRENDVTHNNVGKLVVAADEREEEYLEEVYDVAIENGVPIKRLSSKEVKSYEPNIEAHCALHVPTSGIIDPVDLMQRLHVLAKEKGAEYLFGNKVKSIEGKDGDLVVTADNGEEYAFRSEVVINAAGLYADDVAKMINPESTYKILPSRGEAAKFSKTRRSELDVNMNVYPAPYGYYPDTGEKAEVEFSEFEKMVADGTLLKTVGVHLTPTFDDTITIGPAKNKNYGKEDYGSGLRPESHYHERVRDFFPGLKLDDIQLHQAGIMAAAKGHRDWIIERDPERDGFINLIGIDSPGLTSSLAIAKYVKECFFR